MNDSPTLQTRLLGLADKAVWAAAAGNATDLQPDDVRLLREAARALSADRGEADGYTSYGEFRWACDCDDRMRAEWTPVWTTPPSPAESAEQWDRENLGIIVRDEWMAWAREQPNIKTSWLTPWTLLTEPEREVDRRIGERIARCVAVTLKRQAASAAPSGVPDAELSELRGALCSLAWSSHPRGYDYTDKIMRRVFALLEAAQGGR